MKCSGLLKNYDEVVTPLGLTTEEAVNVLTVL